MANLSGWGRFPVRESLVFRPRTESDLVSFVGQGSFIARGNGRAYGDSATGAPRTLDMRSFNRMISFDATRGLLVAESGVMLADIIDSFLPRGWFPSVTPGTRFVTLGGMAAADVHGKNHHKDGSFGSFVEWLELLGPNGAVQRCSRAENTDRFAWTIGGMGLTGPILRLAIRLSPVESAWIRETTLPAANLDACMDLFEAHHASHYSVAWIDCLSTGASLGRSLLMLGEHAMAAELNPPRRANPFQLKARRRLAVPMDAPGFALNRFTVQAFNAMVYHRGAAKAGTRFVDWASYFYPLDSIQHWNRIYGRRGFAQFQCVLPLATARAGLQQMLMATAAAGQGSFLAVLKRLGAQNSRFSFPMEGYTLALDFPISPPALALLSRLDCITLDHGGRFYLAKDSRMSAAILRASDQRCDPFLSMRSESGAARQFASTQSERLAL